MFYLKIVNAVLKDKYLHPSEKIVYSYIIQEWENTYKYYKDNDYNIVKCSMRKMSNDIYIERRNLHKIIDNLIEKKYIAKAEILTNQINTSIFYLNKDSKVIKEWFETNKVIDELKNKWKKSK